MKSLLPIRNLFVGVLIVAVILGVGGSMVPNVAAQSPKAKKGAAPKTKAGKAAQKADEQTAENALPLAELDFDDLDAADMPGAEAQDETPEGKERLAELQTQARQYARQFKTTMGVRQPIANDRDKLVGEVLIYQQGILQAQQAILQARQMINSLNRQITNGDNSQGVVNQIRSLEVQIGNANTLIMANQNEITDLSTEINACNVELKPYDDQLLLLWGQMNECRKQWLNIRQPQLKYALGNYEALKRVIDDWVLLDSAWPDAFAWGALCNYELGNYDAAWNHIERATELRTQQNLPKSWPQGDALRGMIAAKIPERKSKSAGLIQMATVAATKDKQAKWEAYFLLGRAAYENEKFAGKAKSHFEKALKLKPDDPCVKFWYARLQTTTTVASAANVPAGLKTLEDMWDKSGQQSWRLAQALVLAYDSADQTEEADKYWEKVTQLAPAANRKELEAEREAALDQRALKAAREKSKAK